MSKITKTPLWPPILRPKSQHFSNFLRILLLSSALISCEAAAAPDSSQQQILFYPGPFSEPRYGTAAEIKAIREARNRASLEELKRGFDNWTDAQLDTVAKRIQESKEGGSHVR